MSMIDIRKHEPEKITRIQFADKSVGGNGKGYILNNDYPSQVGIISQGGETIHIKYSDMDNFIAALKKAKELWNK